jgi:CBS domain-containing protein
MSLTELMVRNVDTAELYESAQVAAERMRDRNVGALVVVNERHQPIGILTDRDLALRVVGTGKNAFSTTVAEIVSDRPTTFHEDATLESALATMALGPYRRLPIVNEQGELVGLLTLDDIVAQFASNLAQVGQLLQRESPAVLATI